MNIVECKNCRALNYQTSHKCHKCKVELYGGTTTTYFTTSAGKSNYYYDDETTFYNQRKQRSNRK